MQLVKPRPSRPIPIRITPLIDVVFILLVFFMLTSRLSPVGYIELGNNTGDKSPVVGEPLPLLTVNSSGKIQWQDNILSTDELTAKLAATGILEVNLTTLPDTGLGQFTEVLTHLDERGIKAHWQRATKKTP
jgi:biopolymer transport protein ExbD